MQTMEGIQAWILSCFLGIISFVYTDGIELARPQTTLIVIPETDTVTLPCEVVGEFDAEDYTIMWEKVQGKSPTKFTLSSNRAILDQFKMAGRYEIVREREPAYKLSLRISDVSAEDSGMYTCRLVKYDGDTDSISFTVKVLVPIEKMVFSSPTETKAGDILRFHFDDVSSTNVTCSVTGGNPKPVVDISVGGEMITDQFSVERTDTVVGADGLQKTLYHVTLTAANYSPPHDYHGKSMVCRAVMPDDQDSTYSIDKIAQIDIRFAPVFDCEPDLVSDLGVEDYQISCRVRANPPVDVRTAMWELKNDHVNMTTRDNTYDVYKTTIEDTEDENEIIFKIHIDLVNVTHFQPYTLRVANSVAAKEHTIHLNQKTTTLHPPTTKASSKEPIGASSTLHHVVNSGAMVLLAYLVTLF